MHDLREKELAKGRFLKNNTNILENNAISIETHKQLKLSAFKKYEGDKIL